LNENSILVSILKEIALVKDQLKDNADRLKREKTVIVGDVKPMIDSLFETEENNKPQVQFKLIDVKEKKQRSGLSEAAARKAEREKSEIAKSIPRESIRNKKKLEIFFTISLIINVLILFFSILAWKTHRCSINL